MTTIETLEQKDKQTQMLWQLLVDNNIQVMDALLEKYVEEEVKTNFVVDYKEWENDGKEEEENQDQEENCEKCDNGDCIGGRGFEIKNKLFCCPNCGNQHFNLKKGDEDFWEEDEE